MRNIPLKSCGVHTAAIFSKYVWPFFDMHKTVYNFLYNAKFFCVENFEILELSQFLEWKIVLLMSETSKWYLESGKCPSYSFT